MPRSELFAGSFATASCLVRVNLFAELDLQLILLQRCKTQVPGQTIEPFIMSSRIPFCGPCRQQRNDDVAKIRQYKASQRKSKGKKPKTSWDVETESSEEDEWGNGEPGIMKPDITFFGQSLDSQFDECLYRDREEVDLLVIIGTSLKVAPVSEVLSIYSPSGREPC